MRKLLSTIIGILTAIVTTAQVPAFPGAEGHGRYVTGGRGGKIVHVTNLNDSGTGSLREAVNGSDKKIVVFDVGGVIALNSDLAIGANTTIAGQTAPYPGITIRYYTVNPGNNNIIRFIRIRRGQERNVNDGADAIWNREKSQIILDHCSFSWSIDEVASFYDNNNFTMQWCTIAESLVHPGHSKGAHGYGGIWGGKLASFHHNLITHVANRSPRFNGARYNSNVYKSNTEYSTYQWQNSVQSENVDFRNCVIYNCGNGCYGGPGGGQINIVNNYYKTGPAATTQYITTISVANSGNSADKPAFWGMTSRYYINGNQLNSTANADWGKVKYDSGVFNINNENYSLDTAYYYGSSVAHVNNSAGQSCVRIKMDSPAPVGTVTTHTAAKAFEKVLTYAGASYNPDEVDTRYFEEARNGKCTYKGSATSYEENGVTKTCTPTWGRIDLVSDVNGYTEANFPTGSLPADWDTDNDGMPDIWETANGLNPNNASDATAYTLDTKGYYTNIEVYCNALVEDIMKNENTDALSTVEEYYPTVTKVDGIPYYGAIPEFGKEEVTSITNTATYALNEGETFTSGQTVEVLSGSDVIATITYGENGGADFKAATANTNVNGFTAFTEGNGENGNKTGGTFYTICPVYDGTIEVAVVLNGNKAFYILENGTAMNEYNGITMSEKYSGTFSFEVEAGSTYKIYCSGSKLGFYGFNYTYTVEINDDPGEDDKTYADYTIAQSTYSSSPSTTEWAFANDITVTNKNSKDYSKGNEDGIKYSSGVQYTIHLPEKYYVESIDFTGYDNYKESDAYIKEVNGVNYNTTQYVFPMKDSNGNYTVASHTVTLNEATTDSITFTPGNKQVVWAITLHGYIKNTEEEPILAGDANMDGTVTVTDVMVVVDEILGNKPSPFSMRNADISGDGRITVVDAMQIVDIILNMP